MSESSRRRPGTEQSPSGLIVGVLTRQLCLEIGVVTPPPMCARPSPCWTIRCFWARPRPCRRPRRRRRPPCPRQPASSPGRTGSALRGPPPPWPLPGHRPPRAEARPRRRPSAVRSCLVDLGRGEGIMRRDQSIPRENFNLGDRIRCYIYDVRREAKGPQIMLSRAHGGFMAKLFAQEVPEVYDGVIEIRAVARDPGSRAKMAVVSNDSSIDPVGACVGMRGSRVQAVVAELQGEKIDIIQWNPDEATFIVNALAPAEVSKVVMDEEDERVEVVVPDEQLSLAIGRRGQNVRLASQLTGWQIDIMTESQESRAPPARVRRDAPPCSRKPWTSTRSSPSCWPPKASCRSRTSPSSSPTKSPTSRASTRIPPRNCRPGPVNSSTRKPPSWTPSAVEAGRRGRRPRDRGRHPADGRRPGRRRREDGRGPRRPGPRRPARLVRDQDGERVREPGVAGEPSTWTRKTPRP